MKKIYFVRHGESMGNANGEWQGKDGGLTDIGLKQSQLVAERLSRISFTALISSTMQRAKETSEVIGSHLSKEIEYSNLFVERHKPSEQIGKSRNDPVSIAVDNQIINHFGDTGWHYSDEENFEEMVDRGRNALAYLTEHTAENIVVVTHGYFMRIMLACALYDETLAPKDCVSFLTSFRTANVGISTLIYDEEAERPWWLWTWNDHSHLMGE